MIKYNLKIEAFFKKYHYLILSIILLFAFFLRIYHIGKYGLAGDEKYSLFVSQFVAYEGNNQANSVRKLDSPYFTPKEFWSEKSTSDFFDSIARLDTGNGALYTYTLHFWSKIVGLEDGNLRFLSLIFNLLTIILLYVFVKKHLKSRNLALLTAFLATISPFYINYSQIARNYAMQFFLTLLATHIFLNIIELYQYKKSILNDKKDLKLRLIQFYIFYGLTALACELCHISVFPIFLIHGFYILLYFRYLGLILGLGLAMLIPLLGILFWLKSDGGRWLFEYVENSVKTYNQMAKSMPDEYLSLATLPNIFKQLRHVLSCIFLTSEGLYLHLAGLKNFLITGFLGVGAFLAFRFISKKNIKFIVILSCFLISFLLVSVSKIHYLVLFTNIFSLLFLINLYWKNRKTETNKVLTFLLMLSILPIFFLILFSVKDGNTFRIIPRYIGYIYGFNLILISLIIKELYQINENWKYVIFAGFAIQIYLILGLQNTIYNDNPPRYFMSFPVPRNTNPYHFSANKILANYAKGDTIIYCSNQDNSMPKGTDMPVFSVVDAQLTNFYLPKNSEIIQRINPKESNKIILKKSNGKTIEIFDFQGLKHRY